MRSIRTLIIGLLIVCLFVGFFVLPKIMYPIKYDSIVANYAQAYDVDPFLVLSIIKVESNFDINALSSKGACGLMQIMPDTGDWIAGRLNLENYSKDDLFIPELNICMGTWYISELISYFDNDIYLAIAAYNGGLGNVSEWISSGIWSGKIDDYKEIPFRETSKYLRAVDMTYRMYESIYKLQWPEN